MKDTNHFEKKVPIQIDQVSNGWKITSFDPRMATASETLAVFNRMDDMLFWVKGYYNETDETT